MKFHTHIMEKIKQKSSKTLSLDLSNYGFFDEELEELINIIKENDDFEELELNLSRNNIDDEGAAILMLAKLPITILDLSDNDIGDLSVKKLARSGIKNLNLKRNNLTEESVKDWVECTRQLYLNIDGNDISEEGKEKISQRIQQNNAKFLKKSLGLLI